MHTMAIHISYYPFNHKYRLLKTQSGKTIVKVWISTEQSGQVEKLQKLQHQIFSKKVSEAAWLEAK